MNIIIEEVLATIKLLEEQSVKIKIDTKYIRHVMTAEIVEMEAFEARVTSTTF